VSDRGRRNPPPGRRSPPWLTAEPSSPRSCSDWRRGDNLIPPTGNAAVIPALDNYLILHVYFDTDRDLALVARCRIAPTINWVQSERGAHFAPGQKGNAHLPAAGPPAANYLSSI
jgi:hypothetical protein